MKLFNKICDCKTKISFGAYNEDISDIKQLFEVQNNFAKCGFEVFGFSVENNYNTLISNYYKLAKELNIKWLIQPSNKALYFAIQNNY